MVNFELLEMKRQITQPARKTFINCCSNYDLKGDELCVLEFDPGNESLFSDRIFLQSSGALIFGQLELPLLIEQPEFRIKELNL